MSRYRVSWKRYDVMASVGGEVEKVLRLSGRLDWTEADWNWDGNNRGRHN
jgi:hypothetical protein